MTTERTSWEFEFRSRVTYTLVPEHYRHGLVGEVYTLGEDESHDETYGDTIGASFEIVVRGMCPCGEDVRATAEGMYDSAELIRHITRPEMNEEMARATVDPFQEGYRG